MKYTIRASKDLFEYMYYKMGGVPFLDSEHNIFPTMAACAKFHGVSTSTLDKGWFKSKTLNKLVAASNICTSILYGVDLYDGNHDNELQEKLAIYDELFNNYLLKKVRAAICYNGWMGEDKISPMWKTADGFWTPSHPHDWPSEAYKGVDLSMFGNRVVLSGGVAM